MLGWISAIAKTEKDIKKEFLTKFYLTCLKGIYEKAVKHPSNVSLSVQDVDQRIQLNLDMLWLDEFGRAEVRNEIFAKFPVVSRNTSERDTVLTIRIEECTYKNNILTISQNFDTAPLSDSPLTSAYNLGKFEHDALTETNEFLRELSEKIETALAAYFTELEKFSLVAERIANDLKSLLEEKDLSYLPKIKKDPTIVNRFESLSVPCVTTEYSEGLPALNCKIAYAHKYVKIKVLDEKGENLKSKCILKRELPLDFFEQEDFEKNKKEWIEIKEQLRLELINRGVH